VTDKRYTCDFCNRPATDDNQLVYKSELDQEADIPPAEDVTICGLCLEMLWHFKQIREGKE
jgi:hypothetical protein